MFQNIHSQRLIDSVHVVDTTFQTLTGKNYVRTLDSDTCFHSFRIWKVVSTNEHSKKRMFRA